MSQLDFSKEKIEIRGTSTDYGPFTFDFQDALPSGVTVSSVTVESYLGKITPEDELSGQTETTDELIDAVKTAVSGSYGVAVYFNYPTTDAYNSDKDHTLIFKLTLSNDAKHDYWFQWVKVY